MAALLLSGLWLLVSLGAGGKVSPKALSPDAFLMGSSRGCRLERVLGYLTADCVDMKLTDIPSVRDGVTALNAAENRIAFLRNNSFAALPNLRVLYLNENRIKLVEAGALSGLQYLEVVDLSGNRLRSLPHGLLALPRLRKLYFADNLLERLDPTFVFTSPTLQLLSLADCSLVDVPLGELPELLHLNLSGNALSTLPLHDLGAMCRLHTLDISKMPGLYRDLDMEEACQCQTFTHWAKLRGLTLGLRTRIICRNETNSADDPLVPACNATEMALTALELHGQCVRAQAEELRASVRSVWVLVGCVAAASILGLMLLLVYCQRRSRQRDGHTKVPVVMVSAPNHVPDGK